MTRPWMAFFLPRLIYGLHCAGMNRRRFLEKALQGATAAIPLTTRGEGPTPRRVVDTHTHFYDPTRPQGVPWPKPGTPLHRKVLPADWLAQASPLGVRETIVVEASPWVDDNQWILDLAAQEKSIIGFVGNLSPADPDFAAHLKRFAAHPVFRGIRWRGELVRLDTRQESILSAAKRLADHGLALDVNGPPSSLLQVAQLAAEVPDLRIVINHVGGAGDPKALKPGWRENIQAVARHPRVFMKVSGMPEQTSGYAEGAAPADPDYYRPILDPLWESFGPDRLIYGSNWPVSDHGRPYADVFKVVSGYFGQRGPETLEKVFWRNAQAAYRWVERA